MNKLFLLIIPVFFLAGCASSPEKDSEQPLYRSYNKAAYEETIYDYDDGYEWAVDNDISDFDDCQYEFDTSEAEDGCNDYIIENYTGPQSFFGYDCTEDCSGHQAGYGWAEENDIYDIDDCYGNSQSFEEGCYAYVEENY